MTTTIPAGTSTFTITTGNATYSLASGLTRGAVNVYRGVRINGSDDVLLNSGTILAGVRPAVNEMGDYAALAIYGTGVSVTNQAGGYLHGAGTNVDGIEFAGAGGALVNAGLIVGGGGPANNAANAVGLFAGGSVTNLSSGTIATNGIFAESDATVVNYGVVLGGPVYGGVYLELGGTVTNLAGTIAANGGAYGIKIVGSAGTVTNAATISGSVTLADNYPNRVIVDPGAVFSGQVDGGDPTQSILELASGSGTGTLYAASSGFTNFATLTLDADASWIIDGDSSLPNEFGTIAGFAATDTIQLTGLIETISHQQTSGGLTHVTLTGDATMTLTIQGSVTNFQAISGDGNTDIEGVVVGPTLSTGGTVTYTGTVSPSPVVLDPGAAITDSNPVTGATIWFASGYLAGDQLNFTNQGSISGSFNNGTLVLTGTTSAAAFQSAIDSVTFSFSPGDGDPTDAGNHASRTIDWKATDASGPSSVTNSTVITSEGTVLLYDETIEETGIVAASETVNAGVMTLLNGGAGTLGHITVGSSLGTGNFLLTNNGSTSYIVVDTAIGTYGSGVTLLTDPTTIAATGQVTSTATYSAAVHGSSGPTWTLVNYGLVSDIAYGGIGVSLASAGTIINAASGVIAGDLRAGAGISIAGGGVVTNAANGTISGANGIQISGGTGTVLNLGRIDSDDHSTLAGNDGIYLQSGGTVINGAAGSTVSAAYINAYHVGVKIGSGGTGTVINYGTIFYGQGAPAVVLANGVVINGPSGAIRAQIIAGAADAIDISGTGAVVNYGTIKNINTGGTYYGVSLAGSGTVANLGTASLIVGTDGVYAGGNATVVNGGIISDDTASHDSNYIAVKLGAGTDRLIVDPGAVFVGQVTAAGTGTLELASAATAGTVSLLGTKYVGFGQVMIDSGAQWTLSAGNTLAAGATLTNSGTLTDAGTLLNDGMITGNRLALSGGVLTNASAGLLTATVYGAAAGAADTVVNFGTVTNSGGAAIYLHAGGSISNAAGALVAGYGSALRMQGSAAAVSNLGSLVGVTGIVASYGVYLGDGGLVTNGQGGSTSTASVQGYSGIGFPATASANGTLANYGTVLGYGSAGKGVFLGNTGTILNGQSNAGAALIQGGGIGVYAVDGTIINDATIVATGASIGDYGVQINSIGSVGNLGSTALIQGHVGVRIVDGGTVTNAGTIASSQGASGKAVEFDQGSVRLVDDPGAVFIGSIYGGNGGPAVFELASSSGTGTVTGFGTSITNFTSLVFDPGAQWTVSGNDSANGLGTLGIGGFAIGDTIDLTGFVATAHTLSGSTLILTDAAAAQETLHVTGTFAAANLRAARDGSGTGTNVYLLPGSTITAGATASFTGGGSPVVLDGSIAITDPNGTLLSGATVDIDSGFTTGDTLSATGLSELGITGGYDPETGELTLAGTANIQNYESALKSVTYSFNPGTGDPTAGGVDTSRAIQWIVNDATGTSAPSTSTLDVVHAPPTLTVGGTVTFTGGGSPVVLDSSLAVADPDSNDMLNSGTVIIANFAAGDVLSAGTTVGGIAASYASGTLTLTGTATVADYRQVLDSVSYSVNPSDADPTAGIDPATRTIDWTVNDGSTSNGTAGGTSTVNEVHVVPTIVIGGTATFTGGGSAVTLDGTASVTDINSGGTLTGATVWINSGSLAGDMLNYASLTGLGITGIYSGGTLTLSGAADISSYDSALASITYSFNPGTGNPTAGDDTVRVIDWTVTDGSNVNGTSNTGSSTLDVVHVAPTISVLGTATFTGGGSPVVLDSAASATDPDSGGNLTGATIWINSGSVSGDILNYSSLNGLGIAGTYDAVAGALTLTGTSSLANYDSALASITYSFNPGTGDPTGGGDNTVRVIDWSVTDGNASNGLSTTGSTTLDVVHVAPTISAAGTATFAGGGASVVLDSNAHVTDPDSNGNLAAAAIWISSGSIPGDMLNYASLTGLGINGTYDSVTGTLTLTGTSSLANYDSALASVTYSFNPGTGDPTGGGDNTVRVIDWSVSDGSTSNGVSNTGTSTVDIVHVAPTIAAGVTAIFDGGGSRVVLDGSIAITDVDSFATLAGASVAINSGSFVDGDMLNYTSLGGLGIAGTYDTATGTLTLNGSSSILNYESALDSITYSFIPTNADPTNGGGDTSRTISWSVNDGVAASNIASSSLSDVHIAPSITASGTVGFAIGGTAAALDPGLIVNDPDSSNSLTGATISIGGFEAGDVLNFVNTGSISGGYNPTTGVMTLTGTASIAAYQSALASITYSSTISDPSYGGAHPTRTIDWTVTDGTSSNGVSNTGNTGLTVYGPTPAISGTADWVVDYIQQGTAATLDSQITISDSDSSTLVGATVTISGSVIAGDTLTANTADTEITASYNDGTLTLSGTDTLADYQQVLRSVVYASSAADPTSDGADRDRTIVWQVNDGRGGNNLSNIGTTTVVDHVRPVVTTGNTVAFGIGAGAILVQPTLGVADADTNPILTGTVVISAGSLTGDVLAFNHGTNSETFAGGVTIAASYNNGTLTFGESGGASVADWQQALASVTFDNTGTNADNSGADPTRTLTWTLNTSDPQQTSMPVTSTVDIAPPPVISGTVANQGTTDEAPIRPFSGVTVNDSSINQIETIVVTLSNPANGTLSDSVGGSVNNGTYVVTGTTLAVTQALQALVFTPTAHEVVPGGTVASTFTLTATNSAGATASNSTTSVIATAANDPPEITTIPVNTGVPNQGSSAPFAGLAITDPDAGGHIGTLTVALSPSNGGTLSVLSGGTFDAATGVYSLVGTIAALSTALEDLLFLPGPPPSGSYVSTTDFSVQVTDSGGEAINNTVTVTTVTQEVPGFSGTGTSNTISVSPDGTNFAPASTTPGASNEAIVTAPTTGGSYAVPSDYQALYLGGTVAASLSDNAVGNAALIGNSGNDTLSATQGNDTISGGTGRNQISVSGASDVVQAGTGTDNIDATGTLDTVMAAGTASVSAAGAGQFVVGSSSISGALTVVATGSDDTISAGTGSLTSTVNGSGAMLYGGFGSIAGGLNLSVGGSGDTVNPGYSTAKVQASGNGDLVFGGYGSTASMLAVSLTGSNDTVNPGGSAAAVNASGNSEMIYGTFGSLTGGLQVVAGGSGDTINPGVDPTTISGSGTGDLVYGDFGAPGGGLNVSISGANATVNPGMSAVTVHATGQNDLVYGTFGDVPGSLYVFLGGTGDTVNPGIDPATVVAAGSNDLIYGSFGPAAGPLVVSVTGANDTVEPANSPATVQAGSSSQGLWVWGGTGSLDFSAGGGSATVAAGSGAVSATGGSGPLVFVGGPDSSTVTGGAGGTTLFGAASGSIVYGGSIGAALIVASSGNETLNAGASSTNDTFVAGAGAVTFTGGSGSDSFLFYQDLTAPGGGAHDAIAGFTANDIVHLSGYGGNEAATALTAAVSTGGNTTITLSDNTQITFLDVSSASALSGHIVSI